MPWLRQLADHRWLVTRWWSQRLLLTGVHGSWAGGLVVDADTEPTRCARIVQRGGLRRLDLTIEVIERPLLLGEVVTEQPDVILDLAAQAFELGLEFGLFLVVALLELLSGRRKTLLLFLVGSLGLGREALSLFAGLRDTRLGFFLGLGTQVVGLELDLAAELIHLALRVAA